MGEPFRAAEPKLPVTAYKTYEIAAPRSTHFRAATCAEADCRYHVNGWQTAVDESTDLGKQQAYYIRNQSGRRYSEDRNLTPGLTLFTFEPGQTCFAADRHVVPLDRPALFLVRGGDWRGNPTGELVRRSADDWVDDFATHQDKLATELQKG